jgi:tetratricopeptide (TPR) repeat protein
MQTVAARWRALALVAAFAVPTGLAWTAAAQKSVTVDEFQGMPHGLALWRTGDFHLATTVQPFGEMLPALGLLIAPAHFNAAEFAHARSTWEVGSQFMHANWDNYQDCLMAGRAVSVLALALTCILSWGFARSLYGPTGGLLTAAVVGLSPNLLAHGALITPDIYLTAAIIGSLWAFDGLMRRPGWLSGSLLGAALAAAALTKHTGLLLFALYPLVLGGLQLAARRRARAAPATGPESRPRWRKAWTALVVAELLGLFAVNAGYGFQGSLTPLGGFPLETKLGRALQEALPSWFVPLPYPYFLGADAQLAENDYDSYLNGEFRKTGFPEYYLVALLVKSPVPLMLLLVLALACSPRLDRREAPLVVCALTLFAFFSLIGHKNIGVRYVLFMEPLAAILVGRLAVAPAWQSVRGHRHLVRAAGALIAALVAIVLAAWPDYLAYFNVPSGGPAHGHRLLLDSNLDWGQDLIELRRYMDGEKIAAVDLAYAGRVDPAVYGIHYGNLGLQPATQRHAVISANLLWGRIYFINGADFWPSNRHMFQSFQTLKPKAVLGHTLYVYDTSDPAVQTAIARIVPRDPSAELDRWNDTLQQHPDWADGYLNRGSLHLELRHPDLALNDFERCLELKPDQPAALYNRGLACHQLGRLDEALRDYNRSIELRPDSPDAYANRAALLAGRNDLPGALADLDKAIELRPIPEVYFNRARTHFRLRNYPAAWSDVRRGEQLGGRSPDALINELSKAMKPPG